MTFAGVAGAIFSATTVFALDAELEFFAITGEEGASVVAAGAVRIGSLTALGGADADSVTVVCGVGWVDAAGFTMAGDAELATTGAGAALPTAAGAVECALAGMAAELSGARTPRRAAKAAAADSTSFGFSGGAGGSADFGNSVSRT